MRAAAGRLLFSSPDPQFMHSPWTTFRFAASPARRDRCPTMLPWSIVDEFSFLSRAPSPSLSSPRTLAPSIGKAVSVALQARSRRAASSSAAILPSLAVWGTRDKNRLALVGEDAKRWTVSLMAVFGSIPVAARSGTTLYCRRTVPGQGRTGSVRERQRCLNVCVQPSRRLPQIADLVITRARPQPPKISRLLFRVLKASILSFDGFDSRRLRFPTASRRTQRITVVYKLPQRVAAPDPSPSTRRLARASRRPGCRRCGDETHSIIKYGTVPFIAYGIFLRCLIHPLEDATCTS